MSLGCASLPSEDILSLFLEKDMSSFGFLFFPPSCTFCCFRLFFLLSLQKEKRNKDVSPDILMCNLERRKKEGETSSHQEDVKKKIDEIPVLLLHVSLEKKETLLQELFETFSCPPPPFCYLLNSSWTKNHKLLTKTEKKNNKRKKKGKKKEKRKFYYLQTSSFFSFVNKKKNHTFSRRLCFMVPFAHVFSPG
uniref:Uncharacterized protein n=1 Tax=Palpitomonas bilix TaxID=652834 RepID=A0A7S3G4V4_9EUKA|mmetsp:Transcript_26511/g.67838  ORF Transcript_26511/g.67838 Transcript_26511/m.67838 type:complete len:193 (+) Transcript_26511:2477-3055(+)